MDKEQLLHKALNETATAQELELLKQDKRYASYLTIASASKNLTPPSFDSNAVLDKINTNKNNEVKVRKLNPVTIITRIAAVLILAFGSYLFYQSLDTSISTSIAQKETFELPDNSQVVLNANSKVFYNKNKWEDIRKITLDGEAYFKVTKGNKFDVVTNAGKVSVLGTQFNVFNRKDLFTVSCFEGLVSVTVKDSTIMLPASTKIVIKDGNIGTRQTISELNPYWILNESSFKNATVTEVIDELKNQYDYTFNTKGNSILQKRFTGNITHADIEIALQSLCQPLQLTYTIDNKEITIYDKEQE